MHQEQAYAAINEIVSRFHPEPVGPATPLRDLNLDSLGLVELIFEIEERFDVDLPFNANEFAGGKGLDGTVGDLVRLAFKSA